MKVHDIRLQITTNDEGEQEVTKEEGTEIPEEKEEEVISTERYQKLKSLGWEDEEIKRMLETKKETLLSDGGYVKM